MQYIRVISFALALCSAVALTAERTPIPQAPAEVKVFQLQWVISELTKQACSKSFPKHTEIFELGAVLKQREVEEADKLVRKDAAERGDKGARYLAQFIDQWTQEMQRALPELVGGLESEINLEVCVTMMQLNPPRQTLVASWRTYVRENEKYEAQQNDGARRP